MAHGVTCVHRGSVRTCECALDRSRALRIHNRKRMRTSSHGHCTAPPRLIGCRHRQASSMSIGLSLARVRVFESAPWPWNSTCPHVQRVRRCAGWRNCSAQAHKCVTESAFTACSRSLPSEQPSEPWSSVVDGTMLRQTSDVRGAGRSCHTARGRSMSQVFSDACQHDRINRNRLSRQAQPG
jgi:hypothetical protein